MKAGESIDPGTDGFRARIEELEERLREARNCSRYREFFQRSADAILLIDGDTFIDCNDATVRMLRHRSKEELLQTHPSELSPEFQPDGRRSFEKANEMIAIAFRDGSHRFEWDHVRADGEVFPVEVLLIAVPERDKTILHVGWRDITERKRLEEGLRHAQKMEAIGKLAGGIAHDFNNLLVAVRGYSDLLLQQVGDQPNLSQPLEQIGAAASRAADLTAQLLAFSRKQALQPRVVDLGATLGKKRPMLQTLLGEDVQLQVVAPDEPLLVHVDPGQLQQVILNIVTNARDAMPGGGTLRIVTDRVAADQATTPHLAPGEYVRLQVIDSGLGMDAEVMERVFEPFFTTKPSGKGTGLGLSSTYGIVKQSGGDIQISSRIDGGTTVRIFLPLAVGTALPTPAETDSAPAAVASPTAADRRPEVRILVVDDEPMVASLVHRVLATAGYTVIGAGTSAEALAALGEDAAGCDLLLTDVIMPETSGPKLVREMHRRGHAMPVLFMSGYTDDALARHGFDAAEIELLHKPFSTTDLLDRVAEMLGRKG